MDYYSMDFDTMLYRLGDLEKLYNEELKQLELQTPGCLYGVKRDGKQNYLQTQIIDGKSLRHGISRDPDTIRQLCRKAYLKEALQNIGENKKCLITAKSQFTALNSSRIIQKLPDVYQTLPAEYFFPSAQNRALIDDKLINATAEDAEIAAKVKAWIEEPYEQGTFMPEKKVHITSRGEKMRSKNEVLHAEIMYRNHIPFRYEPVIHIGTTALILDFEAMRIRDAKIFYAEHCGMPHNKEYMARHKRKMELYESVGIVPWDNLIVTYGDINGNIDVRAIENELISKLL